MTSWRVLRAFSGSEFDTSAHLLADGVNAYCPSYLERVRCRRARRVVNIDSERPMFPGYLFASFDALKGANDQFDVQGYTRAFGQGRMKISLVGRTTLSEAQVAAVRALAFKTTAVSDKTVIRAGAFVDVWRGLMRGERAAVLEVRGERALISLFGSGAELHVYTTDLETVSHGIEGRIRVAI